MKLGTKLRLSYVGLVIVAVVIVLGLVIENAQRELKEKIGHDLETVASIDAESIQDYIKGRIGKLRFVAKNPVFRGSDTISMADYLRDTKRSDTAYEEIVVIDEKGDVLATTDPEKALTRDLSRADLVYELRQPYVKAKTGGDVFFDFVVPKKEKEALGALVAVPVVSKDNTLSKIVMAKIFLVDLLKLDMLEEDIEFGGREAYAVDSPSTMIISQEGKAQVFTPRVFLQKNPAFLRDKRENASGYTVFRATEKGVILAGYSYLDILGKGQEKGWAVISMAPKKEVFSPAIRLRNKVIAVGIIAVFIAWILAVFISQGISRPIRKLVKVTDLIAKGDLTQRAGIKQKDEVGDLGRSFNKMTDKLNDAIALRDQEILERKNAEEQLKEEMEEKSRFIDMISNEFRTPLTAIREGMKIVLADAGERLNEKERGLIDLARRSGESLSSLVHDIMEYHQLSEELEELVLKENDINEAVKEVHAETIPLLAEKREIKFRMDLQQPIPNATFDRERIKLVLANIVNSSILLSDRGVITVKTEKEGENAIKVTIKDTGTFMGKDEIADLFDRYADAGKIRDKKAGGSGLGLSISKKIIDRHNGKIWVESSEDKGTSFYVVLPIKERRTR